MQEEALVVAAGEIAALARGDRRTLALAVYSHRELIGHGRARRVGVSQRA